MAPFGEADGPMRTWGNDLSHRQIMEECQRLPPGEQWRDKRFPADDPRSIYVTGRPASGKPYAGGNIRWLRPHEVKGAVKWMERDECNNGHPNSFGAQRFEQAGALGLTLAVPDPAGTTITSGATTLALSSAQRSTLACEMLPR